MGWLRKTCLRGDMWAKIWKMRRSRHARSQSMDEISSCKGPEAVKSLGVQGTEERPGWGENGIGCVWVGGQTVATSWKALLAGFKGFILMRSYRPDLSRVETWSDSCLNVGERMKTVGPTREWEVIEDGWWYHSGGGGKGTNWSLFLGFWHE